jgi:hypothetical protein
LGADGAWLAEAIRTRLAGEVATFDAAFGFSRRGGVSAGAAARRDRRDALVRAFASRFLGEMATLQQARTLLTEVDRFKTRGEWPRLVGRDACPPNLVGTRKELLFELLKLGGPPGLRQLSDILRREIQSAALNFTAAPAASNGIDAEETWSL